MTDEDLTMIWYTFVDCLFIYMELINRIASDRRTSYMSNRQIYRQINVFIFQKCNYSIELKRGIEPRCRADKIPCRGY